jgi:hypothetical protein
MYGALPPIRHIPSWRSQGQLFLFCLHRGIICYIKLLTTTFDCPTPCAGHGEYSYCWLYCLVLQTVSCTVHSAFMAVSAAFSYGYLKFTSSYKRSLDKVRVFSVVTGLQAGGTGVRIAAGPRHYFCSQKRQYWLGFKPASYPVGPWVLSTGWIGWDLMLTIIYT